MVSAFSYTGLINKELGGICVLAWGYLKNKRWSLESNVRFALTIKNGPLNMSNCKVKYFVFYSSASNRIIGAKDHASIQINIAEVNRIISLQKILGHKVLVVQW